MSFDTKTTTIKLGKDANSTFLADSGAYFVTILRDIASLPDVPPQAVNDWRAIENWLGCEGRDLTAADLDSIGRVFRSYLATSAAPSRELVDTFRLISQQAKREGWTLVPVPPLLVGVFSRMMAADAAIEQRRADGETALQFGAALASLTRQKNAKAFRPPFSRSSQALRRWSSRQRAFIAVFVGWAAYVVVRTAGSYEFLGLWLDEWDSSYLLANVLIPPVSLATAAFLYKWVRAGK